MCIHASLSVGVYIACVSDHSNIWPSFSVSHILSSWSPKCFTVPCGPARHQGPQDTAPFLEDAESNMAAGGGIQVPTLVLQDCGNCQSMEVDEA